MNRLLNRTQWGESNDPTPVRIEQVLVKMLVVEVYSLILRVVPTTHPILYALSPWILGIIKSMNRLLNRAQWGESNYPTPVRIGLILVKMLMVEVYSLILEFIRDYLHSIRVISMNIRNKIIDE